ncbi:MAG: chorismate-binding protein [Duncaniella sp.]|nr:chorismate-binding protein [Duncaniella sp.]
MKIDQEQIEAVNLCLRHNIPFALFALPGEEFFKFFASLPDDDGESPAFDDDECRDTFFINFFDNDEPYTAGVRRVYNARCVREYIESNPECMFEPPVIRPSASSTLRVSYDAAFSHVMPRLKRYGGKVVLSQHQAMLSRRQLLDVADDYFSCSDNTFRYLCYTPETGIWLGATPELLLATGDNPGEIVTMSLAGTKLMEDDAQWDEKNIEEHELVTVYIETALKELGMDVQVDDLCEMPFCNLKHLCNVITAKGDADVREILSTLSPTPAVAGLPRDVALTEIDTFETHSRRCYAGYVGVRLNGRYYAYVNLRCAFVAPVSLTGENPDVAYLYNLYSGGGIVSSSVCEEEWNEAMAKISLLASIVNPDSEQELVNFNPRLMQFNC